jgi:hypothetical protein
MNNDQDQHASDPIELGVASTATQGLGWFIPEPVGAYDHSGITND